MSADKNEHAFDVQLGAALRHLRQRRGCSQTDLANAAGITFQQVQKYENGTNRLSVSRLRTLLVMLDMPLTAFLALIDPPEAEIGSAAAETLAKIGEARAAFLDGLRNVTDDFAVRMDEAEIGIREIGMAESLKEAAE